jgi:hypothetical protein
MSRFRPSRPSPAMVVAVVAVIAACASSATAASLITSKQIKNGSIQLKDLSRKARAQLRSGLCSRTSTSCQGPRGLQGPAGAAGAAGATNVVMREGSPVNVAASNFAKVEAACNPGERATGGGVYNEAQVFTATVTSSYPTPNPTSPPSTGNGQTPTGWRVWIANNSASQISVTGYVICAAP